MAKLKRVILWFRQDLRLHDNEALTDALKSADEVIPLYVFDPRTFNNTTRFGFQKTAYHRTRFIIESIHDLRKNLQKLGSQLIVREGKPEIIIYKLARELEASFIYCNRERTPEEVIVQDALEKNLWSIGREVRYSRGKMLLYTADLPFPVTHCPDHFSGFRKEVERIVPIREPLATPKRMHFKSLSFIVPGVIPSIKDFFPNVNGQYQTHIKGGESKALQNLERYCNHLLEEPYNKEKKEFFSVATQTSLFSPYLAQGCLSPKMIYSHVCKMPEDFVRMENSKILYSDLLYRDFLRFMGKKHGRKIFLFEGISSNQEMSFPENNMDNFTLWSEGRTGIPIIDANMKQLNTTGFMSKRGRQLCASFLIHELKLNWQLGAEYFESRLIDYDPCSNWGNWGNLAGVGSEAKPDKHMNPVFQGKKYDPNGHFVKHWIPELNAVPVKFIHQPHLWEQHISYDKSFVLGKNFPKPVEII
jgi:deoxyribodipyrimidine photo-lyase